MHWGITKTGEKLAQRLTHRLAHRRQPDDLTTDGQLNDIDSPGKQVKGLTLGNMVTNPNNDRISGVQSGDEGASTILSAVVDSLSQQVKGYQYLAHVDPAARARLDANKSLLAYDPLPEWPTERNLDAVQILDKQRGQLAALLRVADVAYKFRTYQVRA